VIERIPKENNIEIVKVKINDDVKWFAVATPLEFKWTQIAIEIKELDGGIFGIVEKSKEEPILFADFPLVGSEQTFIFPTFLNSHVFWPNEERSCVVL
jgi:hypothetical protein